MVKTKIRGIFIVILTLLCAFGIWAGVNSAKKGNVNAIAKSDVVAMGVDISYHQGNVNFNTLASRAQFVILRLGYMKSAASPVVDTKFDTYLAAAQSKGLPIGIYIYSYADSEAEAITEANWVLGQLNARGLNNGKLTYPVYFDYEESTIDGRSRAANTAIINAFLNTIRNGGYYPGLYIGGSKMNNYTNINDINGDIWVASYGPSFSTFTTKYYNSKVKMWQFETGAYGNTTGDALLGSAYGVSSTYIDQNYCFVDYPSIIKNSGLNGFVSTPPVTLTETGFGYTISEADGNIDFSAMANTNASFAFVRLGNATSKSIDSKFARNIDGLISIGKHRGIIVDSSATTTQGAYEEAIWTMDTLQEYGYMMGQITYPIVFNYDFSVKEINATTNVINSYVTTLSNSGCYAMLFTGGANFNSYVNKDTVACDIFLAWYGAGEDSSKLVASKYYHSKVKIWQFSNGEAQFGYRYNASQIGSQSSTISQNITYKDYANDIINASLNRSDKNSQLSNATTSWDISKNWATNHANYANRQVTLNNPVASALDNEIGFTNVTENTKVGAKFTTLGKTSSELYGKFGIFIFNGTDGLFYYVDARGTEGESLSNITGGGFGVAIMVNGNWDWSHRHHLLYENGDYNPSRPITLEIARVGSSVVLYADGKIVDILEIANYGLDPTVSHEIQIRSFNVKLTASEYYSEKLDGKVEAYAPVTNTILGSTPANATSNWDLTNAYTIGATNFADRSVSIAYGNADCYKNALYFNQYNSANVSVEAKFHVNDKLATEQFGKFGINFVNESGKGFFFYVDARGSEGTEASAITGTAVGYTSISDNIYQWGGEVETQNKWSVSKDSVLKIVRNGDVYSCYIDGELVFTLNGTDFGMTATDLIYPFIRSFFIGLTVSEYSASMVTNQLGALVVDGNFADWQKIITDNNYDVVKKFVVDKNNSNKKLEFYYVLNTDGLFVYAIANHTTNPNSETVWNENPAFRFALNGTIISNELYASRHSVKGFDSSFISTATNGGIYTTVLEGFISKQSLINRYGYTNSISVGASFSVISSADGAETLTNSQGEALTDWLAEGDTFFNSATALTESQYRPSQNVSGGSSGSVGNNSSSSVGNSSSSSASKDDSSSGKEESSSSSSVQQGTNKPTSSSGQSSSSSLENTTSSSVGNTSSSSSGVVKPNGGNKKGCKGSVSAGTGAFIMLAGFATLKLLKKSKRD